MIMKYNWDNWRETFSTAECKKSWFKFHAGLEVSTTECNACSVSEIFHKTLVGKPRKQFRKSWSRLPKLRIPDANWHQSLNLAIKNFKTN